MERELVFQEAFTVARNPMYINMAHANGKFFTSGPRPLSPETIAKMAAANTGKKRTPEAIAKTAAANIGKTQTPEHKAKISAGNTGKKRTPEARAKMSVAQTGKKLGPQSPEHKVKRLSARLVILSKKNLLI